MLYISLAKIFELEKQTTNGLMTYFISYDQEMK